MGSKIDTKSKLIRQLGDTVDLSSFDFQTGRNIQNPQQSLLHQQPAIRSTNMQRSIIEMLPSSMPPTKHPFEYRCLIVNCLHFFFIRWLQVHFFSLPLFPFCFVSFLYASIILFLKFCFRFCLDISVILNYLLIFSRGMRTDVSLVPPIRQTASIFKQPVTVYKTQDSKSKADLKHGTLEKPNQLFWAKRLEVINDTTASATRITNIMFQGLRACDVDGVELGPVELPKGLKPVGPNVDEGTLLQSVATSLHVTSQAVTGQQASKAVLQLNPAVFLNPEQPLMHSVNINEDDIRRQEDRVQVARRKLQEALKC